MNNVNSKKAVHTVSDVLEELGFKTYVVAIKEPKKEEVDAVVSGDTEAVAKLLLSFFNAVPKRVVKQMQQYLLERMVEEGLRRESDE
ncbi:hypothetical protein [uncultured Ligilactobacillus sp.]|uniref:hypothetical protein n=1 Tax=uncultured Ligilactobacillus sp. TaxID=2837633 RepID=UPI00272C8CC5|nr:hypothetical protein [uncultured Ligilactobacillus sp.]